MSEIAVIHVAGPRLRGHQECSRCGYVFHHHDPGSPPATREDDPRDPTGSGWPEGDEVLVIGQAGQGRYMALVRALRPDRDRSDEARCG
jgi:hypothetical protein